MFELTRHIPVGLMIYSCKFVNVSSVTCFKGSKKTVVRNIYMVL